MRVEIKKKKKKKKKKKMYHLFSAKQLEYAVEMPIKEVDLLDLESCRENILRLLYCLAH